jgi:hypothetical protein
VLFKPTVTAATLVSIAVTPSSPSIALGTTQQLNATGTYSDGSTQNLTTTVTWGSLDTTIANISNANGSQGLATPVATGSTTITATLGAISGSTTLTVTASSLYIVDGQVTTLAFEDEFNNGSLDTTKWTVISRHGEYSQNETECNVQGAVSVDANGYLTITTTAQSATCGDFNPDGSVWHTPASWPYSTGDIQWKSMNFTYGTVEIRGQFPSSNTSTWPAFWLLSANCQATNPMTGETGVGSCPGLGKTGYAEIDIAEGYGGGWLQFHVANPSFGIGGGCDVANYTVDENWHVFKTVWAPSSIQQYIDGTLVTTCNQSINIPMFLIIQTQTGGVGGTPNNSYLPANLNVDYVRVSTGQSGPVNGSISCSSPVDSGSTSTCTITPDSGYGIGYVSSTCGGSLSGNVFTTGAVTSNCTVSTTFITAFNGPDTTPPTVTAFTVPATATTLTIAISSFTATDNVGVTGYLVNELATAPSATAAGWSATAPISYTFATAGSKTLYAWAKDAAGNVSASLSASTIITLIDTTPPTVTVFIIPSIASTLTVTITSFTATDNVGVTGYLVNELATAPSSTASGWSAIVPGSYTFATAGSKTLYAWAKDAAGNVSASLSASTIITLIDTTPPTVTVFTVPAIASTLTISITSFTATDNIGVTGYLVNELATAPSPTASGWSATAPGSYTFAAAGSKTLYAWAKDAAGNVSASSSASVIITVPDTTAPTVTAFTIPSIASALTISITTFTVTDNIGVTGYLVNELATAPSPTASGWLVTAPISYTFATAGSKTLYAWAKDAAGNVSASRSASVTITLPDTTAPTVTAFTIPSIASALTISITSFTATDNVGVTGYLVNELATAPSPTTSGWSATAPISYTFATAGSKTLYAWAKDAAGNVSVSRSANVTIDTTPPTAPINLTAVATAPTQVNLNWTASTDNVGVAGYRVMRNGSQIAASVSTIYSDTTVTAGTTYNYIVRAYDAAGNVSTDSNTASVTTPIISLAPVLDKTVTTKQASGSSSISSPSLSTAQPNELLVAFIASDGPNSAGSQRITSVIGGGLTWTLRSRANAQAGTAEIWTAPATNVVTNVIVTATRATGSYQGMMIVAAFQGASLTVNGTAANASASTGAPTVTLTTTKANSLVWAVGDDWDRAVAHTVSANQTKQSEYLASAGDTFWVQYITAPNVTAGVTATISCSAPTNDRWNLAAFEILPK